MCLWPLRNEVPLLHASHAALHTHAIRHVIISHGGCSGSAAAKAASQRAAQQAVLDAERAKAQEQQRLARLVCALHSTPVAMRPLVQMYRIAQSARRVESVHRV